MTLIYYLKRWRSFRSPASVRRTIVIQTRDSNSPAVLTMMHGMGHTILPNLRDMFTSFSENFVHGCSNAMLKNSRPKNMLGASSFMVTIVLFKGGFRRWSLSYFKSTSINHRCHHVHEGKRKIITFCPRSTYSNASSWCSWKKWESQSLAGTTYERSLRTMKSILCLLCKLTY